MAAPIPVPPDLPGPGPGPGPAQPPDLAFAKLDPALPLALLPVRLEVRFWEASVPPELRVRIFPDLLHADGHQPQLTAVEQQLGRAFWERCWRSGRDPLLIAAPNGDGPAPVTGSPGRDAAFAWLAGQLGPWRAAWIAGEMQPLNDAQAPALPVPEHAPLIPPPAFPDLAERGAGGPTYARLLPSRFALTLYENEHLIDTFWGAPIPDDLPLAPGPVDSADVTDGRALLDAQGLTWMHDFEEAYDKGMAIRVNFSQLDEKFLRTGFTRLVVTGAMFDDQREPLEALLAAHRYTNGLDFIGQGSATNATETAAPSISLERPDLGAVRLAEHRSTTPQRAAAGLEDGELYRTNAHEGAAAALGVSSDSALSRATNHLLDDARHGEAIARALWPGTLGHYVDRLMQVGLPVPDRTWLRDWSTHYVRGGALLPTLLVGSQPYGLLPVSKVDVPPDPAGRIDTLAQVLTSLRWEWDFAALDLPRLDPEAGDSAPGEGERSALVSQILGGVAHPLAFSLQAVDDKREAYQASWDFLLGLVMLTAAAAPTGSDDPAVPEVVPEDWEDASVDAQMNSRFWDSWTACRDALKAATTPDQLVAALEGLADDADDDADSDDPDDYYEKIEATARDLIEVVQGHVDRTAIVEWLQFRQPSISRRVNDADDPSAFFAWHPSRADWTLPLVSEDRSDAGVDVVRDYLNDLAVHARAGTGPSESFATPASLLHQLLHWSTVLAMDTQDGDALADGLSTLNAAAGTSPDPIATLERLVREGVSTSMNRLDAWYTGIAAARLEGKRSSTALGIQVGAYGWLEDVKPRRRRASQGYVLAPSAAHATTAAVLRSGWSAFGGDAESAGLAVDLSSDRMRRARWLSGGVRNGQDLGRLLGARFERRMHEAGADALIEDARELAIEAAGESAPPTAIVDGLLLARGRAWLEAPADEKDGYTDAEEAAGDALDDMLKDAAIPAAQRDGLGGALDAVLDDLDSLADASLAQGVFSLVEGNVPEATATLSAAATGEASFPPLRFADSRRTATTITHRLLLFVEPGKRGSWPGAATSGRSVAAPGLEVWLEGVLGDPGRYPLRVDFVDPASGAPLAPPVTRTLADAGLSALDVVSLAPTGEETGLGRLGAVLTAWAAGVRPAEVDPAAGIVIETGAGDPSLEHLAVTGRALRTLLFQARDLDARDLAPPGATDAVSALDTTELEQRVEDVRAALQAGRDGLAKALARDDVRAAMLALAGFQLPGGVPIGADPAALAAEAEALLAAIDLRLADYDARVAEEAGGWGELDELARCRALRDRVALLVGHELPLAPHFTAGGGAALDATFARQRLAGRTAATEWLAAAGRVDPGARRLRVAADLSDALLGGSDLGFSLGQLPDRPGEGWAAVSRPAGDDHARLCLLATGPLPSFAKGAAAGLLLGSWTEVIPRGRRTAALGVHFDTPAARAPQAILLCSAEEETGFSFELVRDVLVQTLELSKLRLVGPQALGAYGQFLPATYLSGSIVGTEAP